MNDWHPIVDSEGRTGRVRRTAAEPANVEVSLDSGERFAVPRSSVEESQGGYRVSRSFASLLAQQVVLPVVQEELDVSKREVTREHVRLTTTVTQREERVDVPLKQEELQVERVKVDRVVEAASGPRQEGDTLIVPVYEEVLVVEKRLLLREEVHVTRRSRVVHDPQSVTLRREEVAVARMESDDTKAGS